MIIPPMSTVELQPGDFLPRGKRVDWYEIRRPIGSGGFGIVYEATDTRLKDRVAIKEYFPRLPGAIRRDDSSVDCTDGATRQTFEQGLAKFLDEARRHVRCRHPDIVRVRSLLKANGTAYIVMDLEDGATLDQVLAHSGGRLPQGELLTLLHGVVDALESVHQQDYLHRDIKPSNIFVRRGDCTAMLLDFGSARDMDLDGSLAHTQVVTRDYAPIEQLVREEQGPWTDIYSVAATVYECMTGCAPIGPQDREEALRRSETDPMALDADAGLREHYSTGLIDAVRWALELEPDQRPGSLTEWKSALPLPSEGSLPPPSFTDAVLPEDVEERTFHDVIPPDTPGPDMVRIPAGRFLMGSPEHDGMKFDDERPQREMILIEAFAMGRFPVTVDEYQRYLAASGRQRPLQRGEGRGDHPVVGVSLWAAAEYAKWLSERCGAVYRLPYEHEWEWAARGGTRTRFWWGDQVGERRMGCYRLNGAERTPDDTEAVGRHVANPFGLHDVSGNVWEWTQSQWSSAPGVVDNAGDDANLSIKMAVKGGNWMSQPHDVRPARRLQMRASIGSQILGFRLLREL